METTYRPWCWLLVDEGSPMKMRTKLWLLTLFSIILSIVIFVVLSVLIGKKGYALQQLDPIAHSILEEIQEQTDFSAEQVKPILEQVHADHKALRFELIDAEGKSIYDTSGQMKSYHFKELADRMIDMPTNLLRDTQEMVLVNSANKDGQSYYLLMSVPNEVMKQGEIYFIIRSNTSLLSLIIPILVSFSIPYLLSLWFFTTMNKRIRTLNTALNQFNIQGNGNDLELKVSSKDEIGQLTQHYNSMTQRIHAQFDEIQLFENKRKVMLANLSHDLRTPLTMLLGYAETIRAGHYQDEKELQENAKVILQRSRYMDRLLDQLLDISRKDYSKSEITISTCNLSELIRKITAGYITILDSQEFSFEIDIPDEDWFMNIDASLIERVVHNLIDNAIRYGKDGHFLGIGLSKDEHHVYITVRDKGKGIAPDHQDLIFERFYRIDGGREGEGLGIGLSIVKYVIEAHQGSVQLTSTPYVETVFQITLPKEIS